MKRKGKNLVKKFDSIYARIKIEQKLLRGEDPEHTLLSHVTLGPHGISWEDSFWEKYGRDEVYEASEEYIGDLKKARLSLPK